MSRFQLFPSTPEGKQRSVLFAIAVVTGFIAVVAATSVHVTAPRYLPITALLIVAAGFSFAFAVLVFLGRFSWLVRSRDGSGSEVPPRNGGDRDDEGEDNAAGP